MFLVTLIIIPPLLTLLYAMAEYTGWLDQATGRKAAVEGLRRIRTTTGHPLAWIYNDPDDQLEFDALEKRITRKTQTENIKNLNAKGIRPSCILVGGAPIQITGVPTEWPIQNQRVFLPEHSIMYMYGISRGGGMGKIERVCSIGELDKWLADEKDSRKYKIGSLAIGLISLALLMVKYRLAG